MADRNPYDPLSETPYQPAAEPVNTFIQPQKPQDLTPNMASLAQGFREFDSGMDSFLGEREQKQAQLDKMQGEADAYRSAGAGYATGVANGPPQDADGNPLNPSGIFAQHSPQYTEAYKQTQGQITGDDLNQKFDDAYQQAGGGAMDEGAFRQFREDFMRNNITTNDPYVLSGLLPSMRKFALRSENKYQADRDSFLRGQRRDATSADAAQTMDSATTNAAGSPTGFDVDGVYQGMMQKRAQALSTGMRPGFDGEDAWDKSFVNTVVTKAEQAKDPRMLGLLDKPVPGTNYNYSDTAYGLDKKKEASATIASSLRQDVTTANTLQKQADEKAKADITSRGYAAAAADPNHALPEDLLTAGSKFDPEFRKKMADAQDTFRKNKGVQDPELEMEVQQEVMNGGGKAAVDHAVEQGHLVNPEVTARLYKAADDYQKSRSSVDSIMSDPTYKSYEKYVQDRVGNTNAINPITGDKGDSADSMRVKASMSQAVLDWATNHPGATPQEKQKAINDIGVEFTKGLPDATTQGMGPVQVNLPDSSEVAGITGGMPRPNAPFSGKGTPGMAATPAPVPQAPAQAPAPGQPNAASVPVPLTPNQQDAKQPQASQAPQPGAPAAPAPGGGMTGLRRAVGMTPPATIKDPRAYAFYNGTLSPGQRDALSRYAASTGRPLEDVAKDYLNLAQTMGTMPADDTKQPVVPAGPDPHEQSINDAMDALVKGGYREGADIPLDVQSRVTQDFTRLLAADQAQSAVTQGGYHLAQLQGDPKAARILDFVAGPESRGNYNAYYGHAGSTQDLSQMTFAQVRNFMDTRGTVSSATGRYQFMRDTLFGARGAPGLMQRMGFRDTDKFTPAIQDEMAYQLLKDRGYDRWRNGQMSTETFANNLAKEWASLPNLFTGRSHYAGDGLNKSLVSANDVRTALGAPGDMGPAQRPTTAMAAVNAEAGATAPQPTMPKTANAYAPSGPAAAPNPMPKGPNDAGTASPGVHGPGDVYANIPDVDGGGRAGQVQKFMEWNSDPVANTPRKIAQLKPGLQTVIEDVQKNHPGLRFVVGSGLRSQSDEDKAVSMGWAPHAYASQHPGSLANYATTFKKSESKHADGSAADLWALDENGHVTFDPHATTALAQAMKASAKKLGVSMTWGGDFRHKKDMPHFELND